MFLKKLNKTYYELIKNVIGESTSNNICVFHHQSKIDRYMKNDILNTEFNEL